MTNTITLAFTADEITTIIIGIARKRNDLRHDLDKKMRFGELAHAADRRKRIAQCDAMINRLNAALEASEKWASRQLRSCRKNWDCPTPITAPC